MDWKEPYLDYYNKEARSATLILNFNFEDSSNLTDIFQYTFSHVAYALVHVPEGTMVSVLFDVRGQNTESVNFKQFETQLKERLMRLQGKVRVDVLLKN
ncbi:hypothetical protein ACWKWU_00345 [Chitinophaga lutea]